jgi:hypothetical protein
VNANSNADINENEMPPTCEQVASDIANIAYDAGVSIEDVFEIYDIVMANCRQN